MSLVQHGTRPSPDDNPAETVELRHLVERVGALDGIDWDTVVAAIRRAKPGSTGSKT